MKPRGSARDPLWYKDDGELLPLAAQAGWPGLLSGRSREALETRVLLQFLPVQRWFGGKARKVEAARIGDWAPLSDGASPSVLALLDVEYAGGALETYFVPLAIARGDAAVAVQAAQPGCVLCRVTDSGQAGVLYDATASEDACRALLAAIEQRREFATGKGVIRAFPTRAFAEARGPAEPPLSVTRGSAEQSNTSVLFGGRLILKLFRRLEWGPNPDFEIGRFLTEQVRFERIPKLAGAIEYYRQGEPPATLGMLQALVANQGDGWKSTLEELARYYERCATQPLAPGEPASDTRSLWQRSESEVPGQAREAVGISLDAAATLGRRTAEMHLALAAATEDPAFVPEPLTADDLARLAADLREHASRVFDLLEENLPRLPDDVVDEGGLVVSYRRALLERFRGLEEMQVHATRIRIHGDYHLGQVLCVENDYVILDFEGEPARPLAERRAKYSPLKDVAGMLRSFSYAAYAGLLTYTARRPDEYERLEGWARLWERWCSAVFLRAYRETAGPASFLPAEPPQFQRLLEAYLLDKALYELNYELNNRPTWVRIPLRGILSLVVASG